MLAERKEGDFEVNHGKIKKEIFAFWFSISLVLNGYASGVSGFSLGSIVFIIMFIFSLRKISFSKNKYYYLPIILCFILVTVSFIGIVFNSNIIPVSNTLVFGIGKIFIWAFMISEVVPIYFDFDSILNSLIKLSYVLTFYLFTQTIAFYSFSIYLPNIFNFGFIHPYADEYADYAKLSASVILRPGSLLSESSFYGNFMLCVLVMFLEKNIKRLSRKNIFIACFISLGIVVSTSTSAIIFLGFIWIVYTRKLKRKTRWLIVIFIVIIIGILFISGIFAILADKNDGLGNAIKYAFAKFQYLGSSSRFGKSYNYISYLNCIEKYFGTGVGNELNYLRSISSSTSIYVNSITSIIIQSGYIGLASFIVFVLTIYIQIFRQKNTLAFTLLTIYTIKGFASNIYFSTYGILFCIIIFGYLFTAKE